MNLLDKSTNKSDQKIIHQETLKDSEDKKIENQEYTIISPNIESRKWIQVLRISLEIVCCQ